MLLSEARDELVRADNKASILLAILGVALSAVVAGVMTVSWSPGKLAVPWSVMWAIGAAAVLVSVASLVAAVYPRTERGRDDEPGIYYFRDVTRIRTRDQLQSRIEATTPNPLGRLVDQLWAVSGVVNRKYTLIRVAIWAGMLGWVFVVVAVAADEVGRRLT